MSIKVIVEFQAKPKMRDELLSTLEGLIREHGPRMPGYLGSTRYTVTDQPDMLVEIAEWESAETRNKHIEEARATNAFAALMPLLAAPIRATVIEPVS
jgi:quinol monooxygenase YgiN